MRLKSLELDNWGPHVRLSCDLNSSMTGIIGANGSGKSSILTAIAYAITGVLPLSKERYIHNYNPEIPELSGKSHKARVTLKFEVHGQEGEITREIWDNGNARVLHWHGDTIKKQADVDRIIEDLVGADKAALQNAVFIQQGELTGLIKGTPATRQEIFKKLINLNFLATRAEDVRSKLRLLENRGAVDYKSQIADIRYRVVTKQQEATAYERTLIPYRTVQQANEKFFAWLGNDKAIRDMQTACRAHEETLKHVRASIAEHAKADIDELQREAHLNSMVHESCDLCLQYIQKIEEAHNCMGSYAPRLEKHKAAVEKMEGVPHPEEYVTGALAYLDAYLRYQQLKDELQKASKKALDLDEKRKKCAQLPKDVETRIQTQQAHEITVKEQLRELGVHRLVLQGGASTCPICLSPLSREQMLKNLHVSSVQEGMTKLEQDEIELNQELQYTAEAIADLKLQLERNAAESEKVIRAHALAEEDKTRIHQALDDEAQKMIDNACDVDLSDPVAARASLQQELLALQEIKKDLLPIEMRDEILTNLKHCEEIVSTCEEKLRKEWAAAIARNIDEVPTREEVTRHNEVVLQKMMEASAKISEVKTLHDQETKVQEKLSELQQKIDELNTYEHQKCYQDFLELVEGWVDHDTLENMWIAMCKEGAAKEASLRTMNDVVEEERGLLQRMEEAQEKTKRIQDAAEKLRALSAMLSREGLPAAFMQAVFEQLTGMIQGFLAQMGANFMVRADTQRPCSFLFTNADGYEMPQELLSGGQAVRLALAMLLAAQRLILPEVGLLILDEPTSHVDAEGVENMRSLFEESAALLQNAGMQLLVVDHNPALQAGFTKSIVL